MNNQKGLKKKNNFFCFFLEKKSTPKLKVAKIILILPFILLSVFNYSQSRYISEITKKIVFSKNGGYCQCCGSYNNLEFDHIVPFSCGGSSEVSNIQLLCQKCNRSKSNSCFCKIHNKKVGIRCCSKSGSVSAKQLDKAVQCRGKTQRGFRCRNKTKNLNGLCHHHNKN